MKNLNLSKICSIAWGLGALFSLALVVFGSHEKGTFVAIMITVAWTIGKIIDEAFLVVLTLLNHDDHDDDDKGTTARA